MKQAALQMFFAPDTGAKRNLADLIMQKIEEKKQSDEQQASRQFDPKVIEVYTKVGKILQQQTINQLIISYRAGKLPKAFKLIPSLSNWEDVTFPAILMIIDFVDY